MSQKGVKEWGDAFLKSAAALIYSVLCYMFALSLSRVRLSCSICCLVVNLKYCFDVQQLSICLIWWYVSQSRPNPPPHRPGSSAFCMLCAMLCLDCVIESCYLFFDDTYAAHTYTHMWFMLFKANMLMHWCPFTWVFLCMLCLIFPGAQSEPLSLTGWRYQFCLEVFFFFQVELQK